MAFFAKGSEPDNFCFVYKVWWNRPLGSISSMFYIIRTAFTPVESRMRKKDSQVSSVIYAFGTY